MHMVRELCLLTNADAKAKSASLKTTQQWFLNNMDSCISWEVATLDLVDKATQASLWQIIMAIPDPDCLEQWLFHLVNKMYSNNGYIFRFKPTKLQSAREIVAGLLVFLKGIWKDHLDTEKFNKILMASAIERAEDAWWDMDNHCVITKMDNEIDQIMDQDQDLFFLDRAVEVNMSNTDTSNKPKIQADLTSTGSISTFRLTVTAMTQKTPKCKQCQMAKPKPNQILDTVSVMTGTTLLEKDIDSLHKRLLLAMQAKTYSTPKKQQPAARRLGTINETQGPLTTRPESEYGTPRRLQR